MITGSTCDMWFPAMIIGPVRGMRSMPSTRKRQMVLKMGISMVSMPV